MKQTLPEQLRLAAEILEKDLIFEACGKDETMWFAPTRPYHSENYPHVYIRLGYEIRIKPLTFPDPPEGREWHNPQELTADAVGVPEWRLMLKGEKCCDGSFYYGCTGWTDSGNGDSGASESMTYRTRAPLPAPTPARVPLTAADVPVGSVFRHQSAAEYCWANLQSVNGEFVKIDDEKFEWVRLHEGGWLIQRPGQDWTECSKPAE